MATTESISATTVVSAIAGVSFQNFDIADGSCGLFLHSGPDGSRKAQYFRTDREAIHRGGVIVDFETDTVLMDDEMDDPLGPRVARRVGNRKHGRAANRVEGLGHRLHVGTRDIHDVAAGMPACRTQAWNH